MAMIAQKQVWQTFRNVPRTCFCRILSPKLRIMQGFGAQTHLLFWGHRAPTIWENKKEVSNGPQKVTDPIFVNPPPEGLL